MNVFYYYIIPEWIEIRGKPGLMFVFFSQITPIIQINSVKKVYILGKPIVRFKKSNNVPQKNVIAISSPD